MLQSNNKCLVKYAMFTMQCQPKGFNSDLYHKNKKVYEEKN